MTAVLLLQFIFALIVPPFKGNTANSSTEQDKSALHHRTEELCDLSKSYWYSDPKKAVAFGKEAIEAAAKIEDKKLLAKAYNNTGVGYFNLGDYNTATEHYYEAIKLREQIADTIGLSASYNNIANIYNRQNNYGKAIAYYQKALTYGNAARDTISIARALTNMGNAYQRKKDYNLALKYYLRSLPLKEKINDQRGVVISLVNIGFTYQKQGKYPNALHYLQRGLALTFRSNNLHDRIYAYRGMAETYWGLKDYEKATLYGHQSLELAQQTHSKSEIKTSAETLHQIYNEIGNYKEAYEYLRLYTIYTDSTNSEEITRQTTSFQVKYETAQKEKENLLLLAEHERHEHELKNKTFIQYATIVLLIMALALIVITYRGNRRMKRLNKLLSRKNKKVSRYSENIKQQKNELAEQAHALHNQKEELERLNYQKDKLFSVVAHDLRGPLLSLKSLLQMLSMGKIPEEKFHYFAKVLEGEQQNTLWLVDNLLLWTRSQMQGATLKLQHVSIHALVEENIKLLTPQAQRKGIALYNEVHPKALAYADAEMIKLVLRNLVSNAIKFCSKADTITIATELLENKQLQIAVRDTGIGISAENQARLFGLRTYTTLGTAREKGSGLGLALCKDFIESNGGRIWVESAPGEGCIFKFTLPISTRQNSETPELQTTAAIL
ncbi:tetratricopeptide repeat-containing sensor histidine kinase [Pontibacter burrus]|uniref:histidine kinase n=1 Tax=Pontibacter burrus TaxID=2704466 RepID=A0A6B3LJZ6_9BACT|nr:tetratricopeptide repeat protein [Pontibacter burrus]NEM97069.1 tetratricopeptide repeat protein [Pontibacter burrus]